MKTTESFSDKKITRSEVAEKLQPITALHKIEVKEDRMEFPGNQPSAGISETGLPATDTPVLIQFEDIASVSSFEARIEVLLRSGELYVFSTKDSVRTQVYTYIDDNAEVPQGQPTTAMNIAVNIWDGLENALSNRSGR